MATPRKKAETDPLVEELPPAPEAKPTKADEVQFDVQISPYVVGGKHFFRWEILDHNHKGYVGDYSGHRESGFEDTESAESNVREYVSRVRQAVELKLSAPESYRITL
jgi:hypothetical protein